MWIIQELANTYASRDNSYLKYRDALNELGLDYQVVYYKKDGTLSLLDKEYIEVKNGNKIIKELLSNKFFATGSVKLDEKLRLDKNYNLKPNFELNFSNILDYLPEEHLINVPKVKGLITEIYPIDDEFIMRPLKSNKQINGGIYTEGEFYAMKKNAINSHNEPFLTTEFMLTPIKKINKEYRFFIIDSKIVTYSSYMDHGKVIIDLVVPKSVVNYAQFILDNYKVPNHTVMDIAIMEDGSYKIVEFNTIIASGLYRCDAKKIIEASEEFKQKG